MLGGRTITKRSITALGWFEDGERQITGLIKVHTRLELGPGAETDPGKTQYFVGTILKTEDAFKDARTIIETGKEISKSAAEEIIKANKERKTCQEQKQED